MGSYKPLTNWDALFFDLHPDGLPAGWIWPKTAILARRVQVWNRLKGYPAW